MSSNGDWFPDIGDIIDGIDLDIDFKAIAKENANPGSNRHERRKAIKGLIRKGKVREAILPQFLAIAATSAMDDLKTKNPMKDENLRMLLKHRLGYASKEEAINSFMESFRDPAWMIQWFNRSPDELGVISNLYRASAANLCETLAEIANNLVSIRDAARVLDQERANRLVGKSWREMACEESLLIVGQQLLEKHAVVPSGPIAIKDITRYCPGFSIVIYAAYSTLWDAISTQPRQMKPSDFMDALHAYHLPYVDIFRTDKYMAGQLKRYSKWDTKIISSLLDLPRIIEETIRERT